MQWGRTDCPLHFGCQPITEFNMRVFISNVTSYVGKAILQLYVDKQIEEGEDTELEIVGTVSASLDPKPTKRDLSKLKEWAKVM